MEIMTIDGEEVEVLIPLQQEDKFAPAKAPDELSAGAEKLPYYLARTSASEVTVKVQQVVELVGEKKANELCIMCNRISEGRNIRNKIGSLIPQSRRIHTEAMAMFILKDLLEAIEDVQGAVPMEDEVTSPRKVNAEPNPFLLSEAKRRAGVPLGEKDKENLKTNTSS